MRKMRLSEAQRLAKDDLVFIRSGAGTRTHSLSAGFLHFFFHFLNFLSHAKKCYNQALILRPEPYHWCWTPVISSPRATVFHSSRNHHSENIVGRLPPGSPAPFHLSSVLNCGYHYLTFPDISPYIFSTLKMYCLILTVLYILNGFILL